ncbi:MAG: ribosome-associated translation inhibitor RaiA [Pseudomonadota bacterium]
MQIQVHGKQLQVGDALRGHVEEHLSEVVQKYLDRPTEANVTFSKDGRDFCCDAQVHLPTGMTATASASGPEIYAAFDRTSERIEKQIRRHKRQLKDHQKARKSPVDAAQMQAYVLASSDSEKEADETAGSDPVIIAGAPDGISALSVQQAVKEMEASDKPFLVFRNDVHDRINFVFRRDDGNIGWIDSGA